MQPQTSLIERQTVLEPLIRSPHYVKPARLSFLFCPQMMNRAEDKQSGAPIDTSIYNMKITCEVRELEKQTDNLPTVSCISTNTNLWVRKHASQ